jgi:hypothetical protein
MFMNYVNSGWISTRRSIVYQLFLLLLLFKNSKAKRSIVAILPRRNHNSTYSLKAIQEELKQWKLHILL